MLREPCVTKPFFFPRPQSTQPTQHPHNDTNAIALGNVANANTHKHPPTPLPTA